MWNPKGSLQHVLNVTDSILLCGAPHGVADAVATWFCCKRVTCVASHAKVSVRRMGAWLTPSMRFVCSIAPHCCAPVSCPPPHPTPSGGTPPSHPTPPDTTTLSGQGFCSSCICAVGSALVIGFEKAGVLINGQRVSDLASSTDPAGTGAVDMLMANCSTLLGLQVSLTVRPAVGHVWQWATSRQLSYSILCPWCQTQGCSFRVQVPAIGHSGCGGPKTNPSMAALVPHPSRLLYFSCLPPFRRHGS